MKILQLIITLHPTYIKPPIWRRVLVKSDITFNDLHNIIQVSMDWTNSHLWEFNYGKKSIGIPSEDFFEDTEDANEILIKPFFKKVNDKIDYTYDFGDSWNHKIVLEKILQENSNIVYPTCVAGKRCSPPEDCGGVPRYFNVIEIMADKKHLEHKEMKDWLGGGFDPEDFDLVAINECLEDEACWKNLGDFDVFF